MNKRNAAQQVVISKGSMDFLKKLKNNNQREWFNEHKNQFLDAQNDIENFASALLFELNAHDVIETATGKKALYRIYKDVRFSKEKTPYKTHWSGSFKRAGKQRRGGYYFHLELGNSFIAGGFWAPSPEDLKRIRDEFVFDDVPVRKILKSKSFTSTFNTLQGEKVKTTPKGYQANLESIDLIRYKQFLLIKPFSDEDVLKPTFLKEANQTFKNMRPFFDYMSEVLTSDLNGLEI